MNVDEMDLLGRELEVTPWRPEAYERSRAVLRAAIAESASQLGSVAETRLASVTAVDAMRGKGSARVGKGGFGRWGTRGKVGLGVGLGAVAAGAALVLAVTASPQTPSSPGTDGTALGGAASAAPVVESPLISLAAYITASSGPVAGDSTLVIRAQAVGGRRPEVSYNLYTDSGEFYGGGDKKSLALAISRHENEASGITGREVAAARYAVKGDLDTARKRMVNAAPNDFGVGLSAAERQKIWDKALARDGAIWKAKGSPLPKHPPTGKRLQALIGNRIWNNGVDAMTAGGGDPQVRAGVLRLLSTVSEITVKKSTTGATDTLTLTAGSVLFSGGSPQVLTVDAKTGMPIKSVVKAGDGAPASVSTFKVSRLTLADAKTGKY